MVELEFSVMFGDSEAFRVLQTLLKTFTSQTRIRVKVTPLEWDRAWDQMLNMAFRGQGADISEISFSWLADLTSMRAALPVPPLVQAELGGAERYLRGSWHSCLLPGDEQLWALPWFSGTHVLYYRQDWLAEAGLDEGAAFASAQALEATLQALQARGVERPWVVSTQGTTSTIHHLTSWVLGAGGDFISPDGKRVLFAEPEALDGMAAYFNLCRYLGPGASELDDARAAQLFWGGQAAVTLEGQWIYAGQKNTCSPVVRPNLGVARVPGVPFVGGSNLMVWKHSRSPEAAWQLARFLTGPAAAALYSLETNLLPTRWDLFEASAMGQDPVYRLFANAVDQGRTWPVLPYGTLIETRLRSVLQRIWRDILAEPHPDARAILEKHLFPLQRRLQLTIESQG